MAQYEIEFNASAAREFRKLTPDIKSRIRKSINNLREDPRPAGVKKLLGETRLYRIRIGDYRVVYAIDDLAQILLITRIGHRRDVYQ